MTENGAAIPGKASATGAEDVQAKGKGKAATAEQPVDTAMDEDDDDDDEEEEVRCYYFPNLLFHFT